MSQVQTAHILKKHRGSRRPASHRNPNITQSKEEAIAQVAKNVLHWFLIEMSIRYYILLFYQIQALRQQVMSKKEESGAEAMYAEFARIAREESDCGSAERGGDLGLFSRGKASAL